MFGPIKFIDLVTKKDLVNALIVSYSVFLCSAIIYVRYFHP